MAFFLLTKDGSTKADQYTKSGAKSPYFIHGVDDLKEPTSDLL